MNQGYIKLYRKMTDWEWFSEPNMVAMFIYCLLSANWEDREYKGMVIHRGEFVTSLKKLSTETGLSVQQTRNTLKKLIATQSITKWISPSKQTIIRVCEYEKYQSNTSSNTQTTQVEMETQHRTKNKEYNPNVYNYIRVRTREENTEKRLFAPRVKLKRG